MAEFYEALNNISLGAPSENLEFSINNKMAAIFVNFHYNDIVEEVIEQISQNRTFKNISAHKYEK